MLKLQLQYLLINFIATVSESALCDLAAELLGTKVVLVPNLQQHLLPDVHEVREFVVAEAGVSC